ncbi:MAG: LysR family transcriptional regulator [Streptomyces sp.]|nr:LysR family transcriptional regulator [Streptomyces sp.]NUT30413.1 LysR family transcriptional regulator [Streptomyces sp.]
MDVDLRHLRYFLAVAEDGGFSAAGRRLHVAQPTLTRCVRSLEDALGVRLFDRTTRRTQLTAKGRRLHDELVPVLRKLEATLDGIRVGEQLRLGFSWGLPDGLSLMAASFAEEAGVRVEFVRCDTPLAGLDTGAVDLALLRGDSLPRHLRSVFLYEERRVAAVPGHWALAERDELAWEELADWPLIVNTVSGVTVPHMWAAERRPVLGAECSNYDEWLEKVAAGLGIGTAPEDSTRRYHHPSVRFIPLRDAPTVRLHLAYPAHGSHPQAPRFAETVWADASTGRLSRTDPRAVAHGAGRSTASGGAQL